MVVYWKEFGQILEEGSLNLPTPEPLPARSVLTTCVFIGDDAFTLKLNFTRICNYRFSCERRILENVFGIITNHWRAYRSLISLHPKMVYELDSRKSAYIPPGVFDTYDPTTQSFIPGSWRKENNRNYLIQLQPLQHGNNPSVVAKKIREDFREYFSLGGVVNWQCNTAWIKIKQKPIFIVRMQIYMKDNRGIFRTANV